MNASRFTLSGGVAVTAATLDPEDPRRVVLATGPQTQGTVYTVTVAGVTDTSGTAVAANTIKTFTAWKIVEGWATTKIYLGVAGGTVADLTGSAAYLAEMPSEVRWVKGFQLNNDPRGPNLGAEISAFFTPPASGAYNFYVNNDDEAELLLSSGQAAAGLISLGVFAPSPAAFDDLFVAPSLALTANTRYLLVGQVKSAGGDFRLNVAAQSATSATPAASLPVLGGHRISTFVNPDLGNVTFDTQPANAVAAGDANGVMLQGFIDVGASLDPLEMTLLGVPSGNYNLIIYSVGFPFQASYEEGFTVIGATTYPTLHVKAESGLEFNANPAFRRMTSTDANNRGPLGNYVQFDNIRPAADGSILISAVWESTNVGNTHQPAVNAIQLVKFGEAPPQPVSLSAALQAGNLILSWPASAAGFVLESSATLGAGASWAAVTGTSSPLTGAGSSTVSLATGARFYRLRK